MGQAFFKYHGTGNDFILIDDRQGIFPGHQVELVRSYCDRHTGIGGDGLILLRHDTPTGLLRMDYFNADGRPGSMCGNGGRCFVKFCSDLGLYTPSFSFRAFDGVHSARILDSGLIELSMSDCPEPVFSENAWVINTGSPHYVLFVEALTGVDVFNTGRKIRYSDAYREEGINVNVVEIQGGTLHMATYERGVENITLSCGTGVTAAALCYAFQKKVHAGTIPVQTLGGQLQVSFQRTSVGFSEIFLTGPAQKVFAGQIFSG